ncbi:hypothetical protein [Catenulispora pinisilvae]|uniref:hypothetical protein n=1 Tax=Catenulispora pinisilvae TaxID=2705253 RepID=UPI00189217D5|nr:hypothetical protein [Catenulispora pinisilvae]
MTELAERLRLFEPLLDDLATVFCPSVSWQTETSGDPVFDAYSRCEAKRFKIGEACATGRGAVQEHTDQIMHAIAHDHCPSGDRQLIEPLVRSLGAREVMERVLDYLETGSTAERMGAAMAWYWAVPSVQYATVEELHADLETRGPDKGATRVALSPLAPTPADSNAEARALRRELEPRFRVGCLRAFLASNAPEDRLYLSSKFTLNLAEYPPALHAEVERAAQIAATDPEHHRHRDVTG